MAMHIRADAVILAVRQHGEHGAIVRALTAAHGLQAGYVRGGRSRQLRPVLQPANLVIGEWRARTEEQLAQLSVELVHSRAPLYGEPLPAAALEWITALTAAALPEGNPYPQVFAALADVGPHRIEFPAAVVGLLPQPGQAVQRGPQGIERLGAGPGDVGQPRQLAANFLGIPTRQQGSPGRQAAGILGAQLRRQRLLLALELAGLLAAGRVQPAQGILQHRFTPIQFGQLAADVGNRLLGGLQRTAGVLARGFRRLDALLQRFDLRAQGGPVFAGARLACLQG